MPKSEGSRSRGFAQRPAASALLLCLALLPVGCGRDDRQPRKESPPASSEGWQEALPWLEEMPFDADPAMLGIAAEDSSLGLRFSPPRGWPPIEPELLDATRAIHDRIAPPSERFMSRPHRIYYEKDQSLFMIVSEFPKLPAAANVFRAFSEYRSLLETRVPGLSVQEKFYRHGGFDVYQLALTNTALVNFRLILMRAGRRPVQIDYLVPQEQFARQIKGIEASIGSIRAL